LLLVGLNQGFTRLLPVKKVSMAPLNSNILAAKEGVNKAAEIFNQYGDFIYSVIRFQARKEANVNDLFQDFFLSVAFNPPPPDVRNIKNYLYRAITNDIIDAVRRFDNYHSYVRRYADGFEYIQAKSKPENVAMDVEETGRMFEIIRSKLPPSEALAITLRYGHGHDIGEVAKKMNVDTRTVSRYISVGLNKIRRLLKVKEAG
jgi:RNA polymerase sigma factor (sigma-70 family)